VGSLDSTTFHTPPPASVCVLREAEKTQTRHELVIFLVIEWHRLVGVTAPV
jgi:hypothetical protein